MAVFIFGNWSKILDKPGDPNRRGATPTAELIASSVEFDQAFQLADEKERQILDSGRRSKSVLDQIAAAVLARLILARSMNLEELRRYVQHLQGRYEIAVGPAAFAKYKSSVPADVFTDDKTLEAELQTLSYRLRLAYGVAHRRDSTLRKIRTICFIGLIGCLFMVLAAVLGQTYFRASPPVLNYAIVAVLGFGGALTSIARRAGQILDKAPLSDDPVFQVSALDGAEASLMMAALTGPVFALILLMVFMTGAVQFGDVTPTFTSEAGPDQIDFSIFARPIHLSGSPTAPNPVSGVQSGAKLIVWSFIAGFAEQFVPDVLDRFSRTTKEKS